MSRLIRALVVDDSAFARKVMREMLTRSPYIEVVGAARDGQEALELVEQLKPDVVTCDLIMPRLDGVGFVREQMARSPVPILIVSIASQEGEKALEALEAGAVDFIQKPTALATEDILKIREELVEKVKAAARVPAVRLHEFSAKKKPARPISLRTKSRIDIVLIGISTGGPQGLRFLIPQFPANFSVPIAMVLHMPVGYTELFARKLNEGSQLEVSEAREGDLVTPGRALLAPAGRHMVFRRHHSGEVVAHLTPHPLDSLHRPSVDAMFQSAAEVYKDRVMGVVMTGMGSDGKIGAAWIKSQGGIILTEAEESCIIYGMPRSVVEAGLSDGVVPLDGMAQAIMQRI